MLIVTGDVGVALPSTPGVSVAPAAGVLSMVPVLVAAAAVGFAESGQASRSTRKSVQVVVSVQILSVTGVNSGPLHSTTCLPLFTSTVVHMGVVAATDVVDVVVAGGGDTISKVAVSGNTNRA